MSGLYDDHSVECPLDVGSTHAPPAQLRGPGRRWARRRRSLALASSLLALVVLLGLVVAGYGLYLNGKVHRIAVGHLSPASGTAPSGAANGGGTENIMLVGSTSRCDLKIQEPQFGLCSQGVTGVNSDVIMIMHLDRVARTVSVLSIPRDTFIPNARAEGANKIDAALAQGPTQLVDAVQQDFGIPVQHYVELNFETFAAVVNALGGVHMNFPEPVFDAFSGLNVGSAGCRALNGSQALQVVRARHLQHQGPATTAADARFWPQESQSDLARIRRTHEFLRVLAGAAAQRGLANPLTGQRLAAAVAPQLQVDSGLDLASLTNLLLTYRNVNIGAVPQLTLPVVSTTSGSYRYKGGNYGEIVWPSQPQDEQTIGRFLNIDAANDTMTGRPLPAPDSVSVSVRTGTGMPAATDRTTVELSGLGFRVLRGTPVPPVAAESETVVSYASPQYLAAAETVLHALSGYAVLAMNPAQTTPGSQVTVITGSHFSVAHTGIPGQSASNGPDGRQAAPGLSATAPLPTPVRSVGVQAGPAPTPATEPLAAWDPRACSNSQ